MFVCLGKLFQTLAPLYEKHFCPFDVVFFGVCKSVSVFLMLFEEEYELLVKRSFKYSHAKLLTDFNVIVLS